MEIPVISMRYISFYQLMIILSIILGEIYLIFQKQYTVKQEIVITITTIISGLIGARVFYIIVNYKTITMRKAFSTSFTYFKIYGALIFALINVIILSKIYKIKLTQTLEPLLKWFYIGGAISKIGCFFTGCCKGSPTALPWAVYRKYDVVKVHPSELYDSGAFIFSFIVLCVLKRQKVKDTSRMAISLATYVILRGIIESTYYNGIFFGNRVAKIFYVITLIICASFVVKDIFCNVRKEGGNK